MQYGGNFRWPKVASQSWSVGQRAHRAFQCESNAMAVGARRADLGEETSSSLSGRRSPNAFYLSSRISAISHQHYGVQH